MVCSYQSILIDLCSVQSTYRPFLFPRYSFCMPIEKKRKIAIAFNFKSRFIDISITPKFESRQFRRIEKSCTKNWSHRKTCWNVHERKSGAILANWCNPGFVPFRNILSIYPIRVCTNGNDNVTFDRVFTLDSLKTEFVQSNNAYQLHDVNVKQTDREMEMEMEREKDTYSSNITH